jgi:CRP-like cAMP-binding protein
MIMGKKDILLNIELFNGLSDDELNQVAAICQERVLNKGEILAVQGETGSEFFIITEGLVEILVKDKQKPSHYRVVANLGTGQIIGKLGLVDQRPRSATVRAITQPTEVQVIHYIDFLTLCENNSHIGYIVMGNLAADTSFKLRRSNIISA